MNRSIGRMSATKVAQLVKQKPPGMHADGGGLYVQIDKAGVCSWIFRFGFRKKSHYMGLGRLDQISLANARVMAADCRKQLALGHSPLEARRRERQKEELAAVRGTTFQACADAYIDAKRDGWRNRKHAQQWENTLKTYAGPVIGHLPAQAVDTAMVVQILKPIWSVKPQTAGRVRGRIEAVLDWAKTCGYRDGENPARWRGHLKHLLAAPGKLRRGKNHASLPYGDIGEFTRDLRHTTGLAARALELTILTASRTQEVLGARWEEFDIERKVWTVPAERMKAGRLHKIPLSQPVLTLLAGLPRTGPFVFPSQRPHRPLCNMAMAMVVRRMKKTHITVHGFRSSFRDWVADCTQFPGQVAEAALAHAAGDKTEAAYLRTDFFLRRCQLMEAWGAYCGRLEAYGKLLQFSDKRSA